MPVLFLQYLFWHFIEVPKNILAGWKNFLRFGLNYFSIPLLLKTLFSPWHKYVWHYPKGLNLGKYAEVFLSNAFSVGLGFIMRVILILIGILTEFFIALVGAVVFLGWFMLPIILIGLFIFGLRLMF